MMELRKTAKKLLMINWSCFSNVCIELGSSTLFTGVNGTGKTTVLDAMSYLLFANTQFNRAAEDKDRSVNAYIHGDRKSNGSDRYLRKDAVVCYIVMEFNSPIDGDFVIGVNIESRSAQDPAESKWFIFQNTTIQDFNFKLVENGKLYVTSGRNLSVKGIPIKSSDFLGREKAKPMIARALGIRGNSNDLKKYVEKILKMMAFKPEKNIEKFVKDSVLAQDDVNSLQSLKEQRNHYDEALQMLENNKNRKKLLEVIEEKTLGYEKQLKYMKTRQMMYCYQYLQKDSFDLKECEIRSINLELEKEGLKEQKKKADKELEWAFKNLSKVNDANRTLNVALDEKNHELKESKETIEKLEKAIALLKNLQIAIRLLIPQIENDVEIPAKQREILENLAENVFKYRDKQSSFVGFCRLVTDLKEQYTKEQGVWESKKNNEKDHLAEIDGNIKDLQTQKIVFPRDKERAKNVLQEEFEKRSINTDVRFFAELVEEIKDESWRNAIETFLGHKRYYLIVDDEYCHIALKILKEKNLIDANVVLSDKLPDSDVEKDSASEILKIENKAARKYANYLLNGIHLCNSIEELHEYPKGGLMKDGMLAKSYAATMMKIADVNPCLGKNVIEMQLKRALKEKERVQANLDQIQNKLGILRNLVLVIENIEWRPQSYDFEALDKIVIEKVKHDQIVDAIQKLKNSPDMLRALQEIDMAQSNVNDKKDECDRLSEAIGTNKTSIESNNDTKERLEKSVALKQAEYQEMVDINLDLEKEMLDAYNKAKEQKGDLIVLEKKTIDRAKSELDRYKDSLAKAQVEYNKISDRDLTFTGVEFIPFYREEYRNIANAKLDEAQNKLDQTSKKLRNVFLQDFVAELKEKIEAAKNDVDDINRELKKIPFGLDVYQFKMEEREDRRIFFDICDNLESFINDPEFFNPRKATQEKFNADVQKFLDDILHSPDETEFSDYRNYFVYDMSIRRKIGSEESEMNLSKKQGSASGGEKQTPYFIILAASLMQFYPKDKNCARLAFIDEAFSALSKERIEQMVKFLEDNHFQVFYAAPPEKIDSIGSYIDNTVALFSDGKYTYAEEGFRKAIV